MTKEANDGATAPVLIVGGGIGGLCAAIALANKGVPSHVLEKSDAFGEIGAGIQLGPNVFRAFRELGVYDAVCERAVFVDNLIMMDSITGEVVREVPLGDTIRERFNDPYAVIHRADLHRALLAVCRKSELITLTISVSVDGFEDHGDRVTVRTEGGDAFEGAAVIGADGLWSTIREQLLEDGPPRVSGHIAYRAVLPIEEVPEEMRTNTATLWAGPRNHLVHYPLRNSKLFNLVAVFHSDLYVEGWDEVGDKDELMRRFKDVGPKPMSLVKKVETWRMWVLCDREPISGWSRGRVTLLGDAAHPMLQYFAQGAAMATEDAVCLAQKVAASDGDFAAAFQAYQKTRYLRTGRVQMTARFLGDIYHATDVVRELRNLVFGGGPGAGSAAHDGLAWLYGGALDTAS